ncbi:MAG TPA: hypothetical protein VK982_15570 [Bacteroidales bacterium]|nr:hypothetical protein [Bacteroidales bacterium]
MKALNKDFKPKLLPIIEGDDLEMLQKIITPVYLIPLPVGLPIIIRSGFLYHEEKLIKNLNIKQFDKLGSLIKQSRKLKITIEALLIPKQTNLRTLKAALFTLDGNIDNSAVLLTDMVFENIPEVLNFEIRIESLRKLFETCSYEGYIRFPKYTKVNKNETILELINYYNLIGYHEFIISKPDSKYKFENNINSVNIVKLRSKKIFKGILKKIEPKIVSKELEAYRLIVTYNNSDLTIPLTGLPGTIRKKLWLNADRLIGDLVLFNGIVMNSYDYPKFRSFIRFEKT